MRRIPILPLIVFAVLVSLVASPLAASADGVIIVDPPVCDPVCPDPVLIADQLDVQSHRVDVSIADQVATTQHRPGLPQSQQLGRRRNLHLPHPAGRGHLRLHDDRRRRAGRGQAARRRRSAPHLRRHRAQPARPGAARIHRRGRHPGQRLPDPAGRRPAHRDRIRRDRSGRRRALPLPLPAEHRALLRATAGGGQRPRRGRNPRAAARRLLAVARRRRRPARRLPFRGRLRSERRPAGHRFRALLQRLSGLHRRQPGELCR